jgi:dihydropteroate synthase
MDPGIGFAKTAEQSAMLVAKTAAIVQSVSPHLVLVGASRKSFIKSVDPTSTADDRIGGSIAAAIFAVRHGAAIVRVHDVRATKQAIALTRRFEVP